MLNLPYENALRTVVDEHKIEQIRKNSEVIVFGAGESGDWVVKLLRRYGIEPLCICDNYEKKWGLQKSGLTIYSFYDAIKMYPNAVICIGSMWSEEITEQIKRYDVGLLPRVYDLLTSMAWETSEKSYLSEEENYIREHEREFEKIFVELADEKSRETLLGILSYRLTRNKEYIKNIRSKNMIYFDEELYNDDARKRIASGTIVDGGGFDGDTVASIINCFGVKTPLKVHTYEAGIANCKQIFEKINGGEYKGHDVTVHHAALWEKDGEYLDFDGNGLSGAVKQSKIDTDKSGMVISEAIDSGKLSGVSFVKMDIEGAERHALAGAMNTIKRDRPILAICTYHLQDDLLVLVDIIKSFDCDYELYLRHYMLSAGDTVLYAIPRRESKNGN